MKQDIRGLQTVANIAKEQAEVDIEPFAEWHDDFAPADDHSVVTQVKSNITCMVQSMFGEVGYEYFKKSDGPEYLWDMLCRVYEAGAKDEQIRQLNHHSRRTEALTQATLRGALTGMLGENDD